MRNNSPILSHALIFRYLLLVTLFCSMNSASASTCLAVAAQHYGLRHDILSAVLAVEGGRVGLKKKNTNGSYDMGPMQINSIWLPELKRRGISEEDVVNDYCTNIMVGAWILARVFKESGFPQMNTADFWEAVGRYNSRTPKYNAQYAVRVWRQAKRMQGR